jgi:hypothetical protein
MIPTGAQGQAPPCGGGRGGLPDDRVRTQKYRHRGRACADSRKSPTPQFLSALADSSYGAKRHCKITLCFGYLYTHRKTGSAHMHRPSLFSNSQPLAFSSPVVTVLPSFRCCYKKKTLTTVHAEEPKVTREYREDDDSVVSASTGQPAEKNPNSMYIDEMPEVSNRALYACVAINL